MNYLEPGLRRPLSRSEENAFYGQALTATATELGRKAVCDDMELVSEFLTECSDAILFCDYFKGITTPRLVSEVLLNPQSSDEQLAAAAKEFRVRLLDHHKAVVMREAARSME